jgi:hypothetical protein
MRPTRHPVPFPGILCSNQIYDSPKDMICRSYYFIIRVLTNTIKKLRFACVSQKIFQIKSSLINKSKRRPLYFPVEIYLIRYITGLSSVECLNFNQSIISERIIYEKILQNYGVYIWRYISASNSGIYIF